MENSISLIGGRPGTSSGNTSEKSPTTGASKGPISVSTDNWVRIKKHWDPSFIALSTYCEDTNKSSSSKLGNNTFLSLQSMRMWLADSQSIPKMTSSPTKGKQMRFTLYLRPSTSILHLTHTVEVLTNPEAGVDTTRSYRSSFTRRPNFTTLDFDTKECVGPESNRTCKLLPAITQDPMIRLPDSSTSAPVTAYTRPAAYGLAPPLNGCHWGCGECLGTVLLSTGQSLMKWPTWPHLWHALLSESWGQALLRWGPLQWKHCGLEGWDCWGWCENLLGL